MKTPVLSEKFKRFFYHIVKNFKYTNTLLNIKLYFKLSSTLLFYPVFNLVCEDLFWSYEICLSCEAEIDTCIYITETDFKKYGKTADEILFNKYGGYKIEHTDYLMPKDELELEFYLATMED